MTATETSVERVEARERRPRWHWVLFGALGLVIAAVVVFGIVIPVAMRLEHAFQGEAPSFPSLMDQPDPSIRGTVAYVDDGNCVSVAPAGGGASKRVLCPPSLDPSKVAQEGKPIGPQLVWLPDGRLEVTMINMDVAKTGSGAAPDFKPSWQKIVDVRTGQVTDVPAADVPTTMNLATRPTTSPNGERVSATSNPGDGQFTITLTDAAGKSRTLLEADGPGEYTYRLRAAFWAPDYSYVVADDGRILVITVDDPSVTRQLVGNPNVFGDDQPDQASFAVTSENLLPAG